MSVNIFNKSTGSIAQIAGNATGGGGTTVTVDNILSATSENPVQNKVITGELNKKADQTTVDSALSLKANSADVTASLAGKSDTGHTHDDRYYTESETNALLDDKVEVSVFDSHANDTAVHVTAEEKAAWNGKAELSDIPTTLPADGGNADTLDGLHESNFLQNLGSWTNGAVKDLILAATKSGFIWISNNVTGMPTTGATWWFGILDCSNTAHRCLRVNSVSNLYRYSIVYNAVEGWTDWVKTNDGGNAATVNGLTVQTAVPANAKFTDTTYGAASTSANGLMTTGAQTLAGNKTFNGQVIPAGASDTTVAQARKIYAGTSDMTAGTTKLETGAIYLVYE